MFKKTVTYTDYNGVEKTEDFWFNLNKQELISIAAAPSGGCPQSPAAGAVGAGLADVLSGYAMWAPGTVVIKAVTALFFSCASPKIVTLRNLLCEIT